MNIKVSTFRDGFKPDTFLDDSDMDVLRVK